jgi:hypothetical protein
LNRRLRIIKIDEHSEAHAYDRTQLSALATGESVEHLARDVIDGVTRFDR